MAVLRVAVAGVPVGTVTIRTVTIRTVTIRTVTIRTVSIRLDGRRPGRRGCRRRRLPAHTGQHVADQVSQRGKLVERHAVIRRQPVFLTDLTEELRLADAVDPKVRLQIRIQFHDLPRISRLLHHEVNQERFQFRRQTVAGHGRRLFFRRPAQQPSGLAARPGEHVTERVPACSRKDRRVIRGGDFKQVRRTVEKRLDASARRSCPHEWWFDTRVSEQLGNCVF